MKTYDNVTIKEEGGSVILITPMMTKPLIMSHETWRKILADNVKKVMKGNGENVTVTHDGITGDITNVV